MTRQAAALSAGLVLLLAAVAGLARSRPAAILSELMVTVPAGWFIMGMDDGPPDSRPAHRVYLDAFEIDRTEVTNSAFARFVAQTGYRPRHWQPAGPHEPAVRVVWSEADAYCRWAGKRLPAEAEWEKAARGGDGRRYPWGDVWDAARANTALSGVGGVVAVGRFPAGASPYGALDMAGNAAEWVADYYDAAYYRVSPQRNPAGPQTVTNRVLRGGSWASPRAQAQTFFRDSSHSLDPNPRLGFRCARDLVESLEQGGFGN